MKSVMKFETSCSRVAFAVALAAAALSAEGRDFPVDAPSSAEIASSAIQEAIDSAFAAGGGRVVVRSGVHRSGTIYLKSNVELHLEHGAVVLGGERPEDYADVDDPRIGVAPERSQKAFLVCLDAKNVSVTGEGTMDGRGVSFYDTAIKPGARFFSKPPIPRPRMVQFFRVSNVRFEGVTLKDSPGWTVWLRECEDIAFTRVKIVGDQRMINNDGIDFDSCRRMRVEDCDITTGDDCLVMRAIRKGTQPAVCEDLIARNCRLSSACQGVRLGCPSDDTIRNALFENCEFRGFNGIMSFHPYHYLRADDEGFCKMADIRFVGWDMECAGSAVFLKVEGGIKLRDFGHVSFKDMKIKANKPITLLGSAESPLRDVRFENITADIAAGEPITMNATERIVFDRFFVSSGPGEPKPFVRKGGASWETNRPAAAGEKKKPEVKASSYGFDPADSTAFLQKALDSGAARVVIDRQSGPWVTRPLYIRGRKNLELVFEPGVELVAKKGEFRAIGDSLLTAGRSSEGLRIVGNGATLRMHMADYMQKPYMRGEWRHALCFTDARNMTIENLNIVDSGGDAIYLGGTPNGACQNVTIRGVVAKGNLRQGISVISAENLLVENCTFENTCGLPPMDGIDFEPNNPSQRLVNCTVRNCVSRGNRGFGWDVAAFNLNSTSRPVSILFDGCVEEDNFGSLRVWCENRDFDCVRGKVEFRNCSFARPKVNKFSFAQNPDYPLALEFKDCRYVPEAGAAATDVPDWKTVNVAPALSGANLTVKAIAKPDFKRAIVHDEKPGEMVELSRFSLRFHCRYVFYADRAREVRFRGRQVVLGNGKVPRSDAPIEITTVAGAAVATMELPGFDETEFSVKVPDAGFYSFYSRCQPSPFLLTASDAPIALDCAPGRVPIINSAGRLYFRTAAGGRPFAVTVGGGTTEMVHARIFAPNGETAWDQDDIDRSFRHVVADPPEGLWTLLLSKPSSKRFEDYKVDLTGIPGHLFLCKEKTWCIPAAADGKVGK